MLGVSRPEAQRRTAEPRCWSSTPELVSFFESDVVTRGTGQLGASRVEATAAKGAPAPAGARTIAGGSSR